MFIILSNGGILRFLILFPKNACFPIFNKLFGNVKSIILFVSKAYCSISWSSLGSLIIFILFAEKAEFLIILIVSLRR